MASLSRQEKLTRGLAVFSFGLGSAQLVAPGSVNRIVGIRNSRSTRAVQRFLGLREIAAGLGLVSQPLPYPAAWSRVVGDAMDLALLGVGLGSPRTKRERATPATMLVAAITLVDVAASVRLAVKRGRLAPDGALRTRASITVNRRPDEVYAFWRNLERLPSFMYHLESVLEIDDRRSHWVARGPADARVEWDAEIVADVPGSVLAWGSVVGSGVENSGRVEFRAAPGDRGTEVLVVLEYVPPAGPLGAAVAKLFGEEPSQQVRDDLRRFKQVIETGEVMRSDANPQGAVAARQLHIVQREAQPLG